MTNYNSFTEAVNAAKSGEQDVFSWLYEKEELKPTVSYKNMLSRLEE